MYVGKARDLKKRVRSYFSKALGLGEKTKALVAQIHTVKIQIVESELDALLLEVNFIKKYSPKYNIRLTDGKAYPLIRITVGDEYPKVLITRRADDKNALYFGHFPSSSAMKMVLKIARRIFPYQSVLHHPKRICLYNHLGLCPCPPLFSDRKEKKEYKRNMRHLTKFLEGKRNDVSRELVKERDACVASEDFEQAQKIQKQIDAIAYVTEEIRKPFEYEMNPNLRSDLRRKELQQLQIHLQNAGITVDSLRRIECFDISNTQGTHAVGSMVVFLDGEKTSNHYRRFKMSKLIVGPNDFAMMAEVLQRRIRHKEWGFPDLIIVDGGKGQISAAKKVLEEKHIAIPLIGLAKREEIIITSAFEEIRLPKDSPALHIMQRIRDEAHRFAITYHKKLRSQAIFE